MEEEKKKNLMSYPENCDCYSVPSLPRRLFDLSQLRVNGDKVGSPFGEKNGIRSVLRLSSACERSGRDGGGERQMSPVILQEFGLIHS